MADQKTPASGQGGPSQSAGPAGAARTHGPKKVVDSWKTKKWYSVIAPNFLNNIEAAQVPAVSEEALMNRIIEIPLKDITRDLSHMYTTVRLRVAQVTGRKAFAKFIGHSIAREYLRTLSRRRRDLIDVVLPVVSKDGVEFRVKVLIVSANPISDEHKRALRAVLVSELKKRTKATDFGPFVLDVLYNRVSEALHGALAKIVPIRRVEVWKTELKENFDTEKAPEQEAPAPSEGEATPAETQEAVEEEASAVPA